MDFYEIRGQATEPYSQKQARRAAKKKAFALLKEHKGRIFLATLAALLPSILVTFLGQWQSVQETIAAYGAMQDSMLTATGSDTGSMVTVVIDLLTILALMPLGIGLYHMFTVLIRGEETPSVNLIFSRFQNLKRYWLSVKLSIMLSIYSIFWIIPVTAVCMAPFLVAARGDGPLNGYGSLVCIISGCILTFFMLLFYMAKIQSYEAAFLLSLDYEENRARELFFGARLLYHGRIFELMTFFLSFIGWYIAPVVVMTALVLLVTLTLTSSATLTIAMVILIAVALVVMLIYCVFISAYQKMAFICLTDTLRIRYGDKAPLSPEERRAAEENQENSDS